jgi:hypothetical protein
MQMSQFCIEHEGGWFVDAELQSFHIDGER